MYLNPSFLLGKSDLDLNLESAGSHQSIVDHVLSVGHADDLKVRKTITLGSRYRYIPQALLPARCGPLYW